MPSVDMPAEYAFGFLGCSYWRGARVDHSDIATALAGVARTINSPADFEETLRAIAQAAPDTIPCSKHVSFTVAHP